MYLGNYYKNLIWTNHALSRLSERGLTQEIAWQAFNNPDKTSKGKNGSNEYKKKFNGSTVSVIAKKNEKGEWIILSCWMDPPLAHKKYQKSSFFAKLWLTFLNQVGL